MGVRARGMEHKEPGSYKRKDCQARVSTGLLSQAPRHNAVATLVCGFKCIWDGTEQGLAGLPGWERNVRKEWGHILGVGRKDTDSPHWPPGRKGILGHVCVWGQWWGQAREAFQAPHWALETSEEKDKAIILCCWVSNYFLSILETLYLGILVCNSPAAKDASSNSGLSKEGHGCSEDVAQTTEGKKSHCKCMDHQMEQKLMTLSVYQ